MNALQLATGHLLGDARMVRIRPRLTMAILLIAPIIVAMFLNAPAGAQTALQLNQTQSPFANGQTYTLGTGDKLRVTVFGEEDLGGEYEVDSNGFVRLPLIGEVQARGLPILQFEQDIEAKLEDGYLRDARVNVEIVNYRPFYIIGEVNQPGMYPYVNGMTILNAVALAGGFTYRANESRVYIRRNGESDEISEPADQTTRVFPGDFIRIPERFF